MSTIQHHRVPGFTETIKSLLKTAEQGLEYQGNERLADSAGRPTDLVGHTLCHLGVPIAEATKGHRDPLNPLRQTKGTPWAKVRFPLLWPRLFGQDANFFGMGTSLEVAENFLVYVLLSSVTAQHVKEGPNGGSHKLVLRSGLKVFKRTINHEYSGFMVACSHPEARDLLKRVNLATDEALSALR